MKTVKRLPVVIMLLLAITTHAQLSLGIKAGGGIATWEGENKQEDVYNYTNKTVVGYNFGVLARYMFTPSIGVESGLYYAQMGGEKESSSKTLVELDKDEYDILTGAYYLKLPIQALYQFNLSSKFSIYPAAGIYLGYGLKGDADIDLKESGSSVSLKARPDLFGKGTEEKPSADANRFDMGVALGLNFKISRCIISLEYDRGLTNVTDEDKIFGKQYNQNLRASFAYLFLVK